LRKGVDAYETSELDVPFQIGDCLKRGIPLTPALAEAFGAYKHEDTRLSIRQAGWFALLYPALESKVKEAFPDLKPLAQIGKIRNIADQYSWLEQTAKIKARELDTSGLDAVHFREGRFTHEAIAKLSFGLSYVAYRAKGGKQ
jgi:hypothetical protein